MDDNLDASPTHTEGTMVANGTAAPVAKGKITAAQIREKCPPQLTEYGKCIAAHLDKAEKYADKAEQHKVSAGHYLSLVLDIVDETGFDALRDRFCPDLGRSRAFELKSIAAGKKTLEQIRAETRERVTRHRARQSVTSHVTDNGTGTGEIVANTAGSGITTDGDHVVILRDWQTGKEYVGIDHHGCHGDDHADHHGDQEQARGEDHAGGGIDRNVVLEEYFASANSADIYAHIPTAKQAEVLAAFPLEFVIEVLGEKLCKALPANPIRKLRDMDDAAVAATLIDAFGSRFDAIAQWVHSLRSPKGNKKQSETAKVVKRKGTYSQIGVDSNGNPNFAHNPRETRSRSH